MASNDGTDKPNSSQVILDKKIEAPKIIGKSSQREDIIMTAIKFLGSPKISGTSLESKRLFLYQKGLTDDEIDAAFERLAYAYQISPQTTSTSWSETGYSIIIIGIACYGVYRFLDHLINTVILGKKDQKILELEKSLKELNKSIATMQSTLTGVTQQLQEMATPAISQEERSQAILLNELKSEINSIKSILLNRRQFPAAPSVNPTIPQWQLKDETNVGESSDASGGEREIEEQNQPEPITANNVTILQESFTTQQESITTQD